jgi:hypothetical protein
MKCHWNKVSRSSLYCALSLATACECAMAARSWEFQVFLDSEAIGYHRYTLHEQGAQRELAIEAHFVVKFLFFKAYSYTHEATERWRDDCLDEIEARTIDGGKRTEVRATEDDGQLAISSPRGRETFDGCVMSFAYWNPEILRQSHLLNAQTGEYTAVVVSELGKEEIMVRGAPVTASRYRITGTKHPIDLWYSTDQSWLALQSTLERGRRLRYDLK